MDLEIVFENLQHAVNTHGGLVLIVGIAILTALAPLPFVAAKPIRTRIRNKRVAFIETRSEAIAHLSEVNTRFSPLFRTDFSQHYAIQRNLSSKRAFDRFDPRYEMMEIIREEMVGYQNVVALTQHNRNIYPDYKKICDEILENSLVPNDLPRMLFKDEEAYTQMEQRMFNGEMLNPARDLSVILKWKYVSPKGRNQYQAMEAFHFDDVVVLLEKAQENQEFEKSREYQRKLMTPGLRYNILQRDGFRCQLCGRSAKDHPGLELEVDHIVPVSKGGLTIESNLQTLCRDCNRGKAAKTMQPQTNR